MSHKNRADTQVAHTDARGRLGERLCRALDIPPDALPRGGMIEIRGEASVTVRGGGRILEYTPKLIRIAYGRGEARIEGCGLVCVSYHADAVCVEGRILRIELLEEGRE